MSNEVKVKVIISDLDGTVLEEVIVLSETEDSNKTRSEIRLAASIVDKVSNHFELEDD